MRRKIGFALLFVCIAAIAVSAGMMVYNIWYENEAYNRAMRTTQALFEHLQNLETPPPVVESNEEVVFEELSFGDVTPLIGLNGEYYLGILSIPALSMKLPINNALDDDRLKDSPCRYVGDLSGSLVICAHNYKRHFGGIKTLSQGDIVTITDATGYEHNYKVELVTTLHGSEVDAMINNPYELTLFTCSTTRTDRITVRCTRLNAPESDPLESENTEEPPPEAETKEDPNAPKAPNLRIDYKSETIKLRKGYLYSTDGVNFTEVTDEKGVLLDLSDIITDNTQFHIKKGATARVPASRAQVITPLERAPLDDMVLTPSNGRLTLGNRYEVYNPYSAKWGGLPRITANAALEIRLKNTESNAASLTGKLLITYGEYEPGKSGIIAAEIVVI